MMMVRKEVAKDKLQAIVNAGVDRASRGLETMAREYDAREDYVVQPGALRVDVAPNGFLFPFFDHKGDNASVGLTRFARGQLLARAGIPATFAESVAVKYAAPEVLQGLIRDMLPRVSDEGILFRVVPGRDGEVAKGVLSPSYKRIDSAPVFESFAQASVAQGLVPYQGLVTDTRAFLSFMRAEVVEIAGDYIVLGVEAKTSDYGNGAFDMGVFVLRLLCENGMTGMSMLRKVHLGKRFAGVDAITQLSRETMAADTRALQLGVRDVVRTLPAHLNATRDVLVAAAAKPVDIDRQLSALGRRGVKKEVQERIKTMWEQPLPVEAVPEEKTAWRFANIVSLIAKGEDGDAGKDLQSVAFEVL